MSSFPGHVTVLDPAREPDTGIAFTIATLVTSHREHAQMLAAFEARGFTAPDCEFLAIDNTGTEQTSAYAGLDAALAAARGRYVVLVHQDVRPIDDRAALETHLAELDRVDPAWAVAGNAGAVSPAVLAMRCFAEMMGRLITRPPSTARRRRDSRESGSHCGRCASTA